MTTPKLDLSLEETYNIFYLGIKDISTYDTNWNITNATVEITPPGFPKVAVTFTPKTANVFKSSQLGITCGEDEDCVPLPDGIYVVKYSIHPNSLYYVEKSFMRVNNIKCQHGDAFLRVDFSTSCNSKQKREDKNYLNDIAILIDGAVAASNNCDSEKAYKYYSKAKQLIDNFHKHGCGCK